MKHQMFIIFIISSTLNFNSTIADDSSAQFFDQSCREFKELMVSENRLMFLRTNTKDANPTWKAVLCLHCNEAKASSLIKVTGMKDSSIYWHYDLKDFLEINEILSAEDDLPNEKLGIHSILSSVRQTCKSSLNPVNEGSHLELIGRESCVRHEYLRQYLKRKYKLEENSYLIIESKKDLAEADFLHECHQVLHSSNDVSPFSKSLTAFYLNIRKFFGGGLGEYDPIVSRDSKSFQRDIATENKPSK